MGRYTPIVAGRHAFGNHFQLTIRGSNQPRRGLASHRQQVIRRRGPNLERGVPIAILKGGAGHIPANAYTWHERNQARREPEAMTLQVTHLDHCSVLITDVARSRHFYADLLGLREIARPRTFDFVALWFDLGGQQLHLLLKDKPDSTSPRHFALRVADVPAARAYFTAKNVPIQETTPIPHCDRFFIHDPDGNRIEIIQWLKPYDPVESGASRLD